MTSKEPVRTCKWLIVILIFSFLIRAAYAPAPYGWNEDIYVTSIREFYRDPHWVFKLEEPVSSLQVGPVFYAAYVPVYYFSKALAIPTNFCLHIFSALLGTISVLVLFILGREIFSRNVGIVSSALFSVYPLVWVIHRHITAENVSLIFLLLSITFFHRALKKSSNKEMVFSSILFALSFLARYDVALLFPFFLIGVFYFSNNKALICKSKKLFTFSSIFILVISPYVLFSIVKFGVILPTPDWMSILETAVNLQTNYSYYYSFLHLFILFNLYFFLFSFPFLPIIFSDFLDFKHRLKIISLSFFIAGILLMLLPHENIIVRPALAEFGLSQQISQTIYLSMSAMGYFALITVLFGISGVSRKSHFTLLWAFTFFFSWFVLVREWQIQPRYFIISLLPLMLYFSDKLVSIRKHKKIYFSMLIILFFASGLVLNEWMSSSWQAMFETVSYLAAHTAPEDYVLYYPTHGHYDLIYFDEKPFNAIRPYVYSLWESYRDKVSYVVYDNSNYYPINLEVREYLEQHQGLKEIEINVQLFGFTLDTIKIFNTRDVTLPRAEPVEYISEYFI